MWNNACKVNLGERLTSRLANHEINLWLEQPDLNEHRITVGKSFAMCHNNNISVRRMKFITPTTVPYILSVVHTEHRNARYKFVCWNSHTCNGQKRSWFGCNVSHIIAPNASMSRYPAEDVQFDFECTQNFKITVDMESEKTMKLFSLLRPMNHYKWDSIYFSSEDGGFVWQYSSFTYVFIK